MTSCYPITMCGAQKHCIGLALLCVDLSVSCKRAAHATPHSHTHAHAQHIRIQCVTSAENEQNTNRNATFVHSIIPLARSILHRKIAAGLRCCKTLQTKLLLGNQFERKSQPFGDGF